MGEMDRQLLEEFSQCGNELAFARLVNRYSALVYSASYRVLNNHAQAEEVCQETFFKLLNHSRQITTSLSAPHILVSPPEPAEPGGSDAGDPPDERLRCRVIGLEILHSCRCATKNVVANNNQDAANGVLSAVAPPCGPG